MCVRPTENVTGADDAERNNRSRGRGRGGRRPDAEGEEGQQAEDENPPEPGADPEGGEEDEQDREMPQPRRLDFEPEDTVDERVEDYDVDPRSLSPHGNISHLHGKPPWLGRC